MHPTPNCWRHHIVYSIALLIMIYWLAVMVIFNLALPSISRPFDSFARLPSLHHNFPSISHFWLLDPLRPVYLHLRRYISPFPRASEIHPHTKQMDLQLRSTRFCYSWFRHIVYGHYALILLISSVIFLCWVVSFPGSSLTVEMRVLTRRTQ
jgi:hypothetical protein